MGMNKRRHRSPAIRRTFAALLALVVLPASATLAASPSATPIAPVPVSRSVALSAVPNASPTAPVSITPTLAPRPPMRTVPTAPAPRPAAPVLANPTASAPPLPMPQPRSAAPSPTVTAMAGPTVTNGIHPLGGTGLSETLVGAPSIPGVTLGPSNQTTTFNFDINVATTIAIVWNLTITSTVFTTGGTPPHALPTGAAAITGVTAACTGLGCITPPTNQVGYPVTVPAGTTAPGPVKFFDNSLVLLNTFRVTPTVRVTVPPDAYAGTYSSTLTVDIFSGP
jgi:hypothetical protein